MAKDPKTDEPDTNDDVETADAKSGSVDERVPKAYGVDHAAGVDAPVPASYVPQAGIAVPRAQEDVGPGEAVLDKEREHLRIPKRPG